MIVDHNYCIALGIKLDLSRPSITLPPEQESAIREGKDLWLILADRRCNELKRSDGNADICGICTVMVPEKQLVDRAGSFLKSSAA